jgi:AraC-like DNA-binding protein
MEQSDQVAAVRRMQAHIDGHLDRPISLYDLSRVAGYSPWHSARLFRELTGRAPFDYIRALRLSAAALRLQDRSVRVTDVALDFVFASPEGFSRAFSRAFGQTPKAYQIRPRPVRLFMPDRAAASGRTSLKGAPIMTQPENKASVFVQVVDRPARKLILRRGIKAEEYFAYCEEVGCDIWNILTALPDALYEPIGMWLPSNLIRPGTSRYAQGVEMPADYAGPVPDSCEIIDLPPCKMMVFQGQPFDDADFEQAIVDLSDVIEHYNPEVFGFRWAEEDGPHFQMEPQGYRGYIEGKPVRALDN